MKLIIDIPDNYDLSNIQSGSIANKVILNAVKNGTPILDNTTNSDVLKKVFPDFEEDITPIGDTLILERYTPYCKMQLHKDWLDAPYKTGDGNDI